MSQKPQLDRDAAILSELLAREPFPEGSKWQQAEQQAALGIVMRELRAKQVSVPVELTAKMSTGIRGIDARDVPADAIDEEAGGAVLVVCPLAKELNSTLIAFGLDPNEKETTNIDGHKIYAFTQSKRGAIRKTRVILSAVNSQRNLECALLTEKLLQKYRPDVAFLTGISAGVREKMNLADVVVSTAVIDLAGGRAEPGQIRKRLRTHEVSAPINRQIDYLHLGGTRWREAVCLLGNLLRTYGFGAPEESVIQEREYTVQPAIIANGEILLADGSMSDIREIDERIRCYDMESSGFATACKGRGIPWVIFRGVSDFGDSNKAECEPWHTLAACTAASAAKEFIEQQLRFPKELESF